MKLDERLIQRQLELEEESVGLGVKKYQETLRESKNQADLPPGMVLLKRAMEPFIQAINIFKMPQKGGQKLGFTKRFIAQVPTEDVAFIAARRIFESITKDEPIQRISISIADHLQDHIELLKYKKEAPGHYKKVMQNIKSNNKQHERTVVLYAKRKIGIEDSPVMTEQEKLATGKKLIELFIQSTGLVEMVQEASKTPGRDGKYILQATADTLEWLEKHHAKCELMNPFYLPMVSIPRDWTTIDDGGFYSIPLGLIKTRNKKALESLRTHPMPLVYSAVNALQRTPWRINKKVYDVIKELWSSGQTLGDLPAQEEEPLPNTPWQSDEEFKMLKETQPEVVKDWKRRASRVHEKRQKDKSHRISMSYKMFVADKMLNEDRFYFCWNLDWRGRLYPVQSHVNPQSDDVGKSLLEFAEGKPLGERGLYWLKIQLANCFGVDKVSFEERVKWVEENEHLILDSADNPLDGYRFWSEADCPFEFLAACFEYDGYVREGINYRSHISIALDGSCNGLQNFSAMLRDEIGAKAVNLVPQDKPNDIYARVAEVLSKVVERDAAEGVEEAVLWVGKINRKVCKRGVMTFVYGAKKYGMKDQLMIELPKIDAHYLDTEDIYNACNYLGGKLYDAIGEVVVAAKNAMDWLQGVAKITAKAGVPIYWTTPAGFIPRQEYLETRSIRVETLFGGIRLRLTLAEDIPDKLDKRKQKDGIAPNFVHSMDASHLMITVNKCLAAGIGNFCMIHDSYGTHACDTDKLAELLREAFIEQYSQDVLEHFREEVQKQLTEEDLPEVPKKGELDLSLVKNSKYFFA